MELIILVVGCTCVLMTIGYRMGYKAGRAAVGNIPTSTQSAHRLHPGRHLGSAVGARRSIPMDREALSKALRAELNKGKRANPDEVERLAALNNAMVRQQGR